MKVFGIGMFKTGTSSLGKAFDILGFKTCHGPWWNRNEILIDNWYKNPSEWSKYYDSIKKKASQYNAFEDYPWMYVFKEVDEWFPGSKFILTVRESKKVASSDANFHKKNNDPSKSAQQFIERYENHLSSVISYFAGRKDLLIVSWENGNGWKEICEFLDKPIPDRPFPHVNKGNY